MESKRFSEEGAMEADFNDGEKSAMHGVRSRLLTLESAGVSRSTGRMALDKVREEMVIRILFQVWREPLRAGGIR